MCYFQDACWFSVWACLRCWWCFWWLMWDDAWQKVFLHENISSWYSCLEPSLIFIYIAIKIVSMGWSWTLYPKEWCCKVVRCLFNFLTFFLNSYSLTGTPFCSVFSLPTSSSYAMPLFLHWAMPPFPFSFRSNPFLGSNKDKKVYVSDLARQSTLHEGLAQGVLKKVLRAVGLLRVMRSLKNEAHSLQIPL